MLRFCRRSVSKKKLLLRLFIIFEKVFKRAKSGVWRGVFWAFFFGGFQTLIFKIVFCRALFRQLFNFSPARPRTGPARVQPPPRGGGGQVSQPKFLQQLNPQVCKEVYGCNNHLVVRKISPAMMFFVVLRNPAMPQSGLYQQSNQSCAAGFFGSMHIAQSCPTPQDWFF